MESESLEIDSSQERAASARVVDGPGVTWVTAGESKICVYCTSKATMQCTDCLVPYCSLAHRHADKAVHDQLCGTNRNPMPEKAPAPRPHILAFRLPSIETRILHEHIPLPEGKIRIAKGAKEELREWTTNKHTGQGLDRKLLFVSSARLHHRTDASPSIENRTIKNLCGGDVLSNIVTGVFFVFAYNGVEEHDDGTRYYDVVPVEYLDVRAVADNLWTDFGSPSSARP